MKNIFSLTLFLMMLFLGTVSSEAASHYVRAGATGANNGSSWTDAWTTFPSGTTYIRGDEYYVADGIYSGNFSFSTTTSGTTTIKICKATVSTVGRCSTAHGTDTNWFATYGDGQAIFTGRGTDFTTAWWIFDGVIGAGSGSTAGSNPATYGFYFTPPNSGSTIRPVQYSGSNIQIRHVAVTCPGSSGNIQQFGFSGNGNSVTASYTYVNNCQVSHLNNGDDNVIENSWLGTYWSTSTNHGVHVEQVRRPIFRNNIVAACPIQCIEPGGGSTTNISNGQYYNNVFVNVTGTNGVLKGVSSAAIIDTVMYGNTVINAKGPLLYQNNAGTGGNRGSGNTVVNNIIYNGTGGFIEQSDGSPVAHSYNALFNSGTISETGVQIGSGDPFVSWATGGYQLKVEMNPGQTLPAPYNTDMTGDIRGADGIWSRGAIEFRSGGDTTDTTAPMAPLNVRVN